MTIYRLRDIERQDALRKALPHFEEMFWRDCYMQMKNDKKYVRVSLPVSEKDSDYCSYLWTIRLRKSDIEILYDPDSWNNYPEVTPPENTWMRVIQSTNGWTRFTAAIYRNGKWYQELENGDQLFQKPILGVCEFRPWE